MTNEVKIQIRDAVTAYMESKELSMNEFAKLSQINVSYMSTILEGRWDEHPAGAGKTVIISDKWFQRLADFIGYKIEKSYWETVPTSQFKAIITALENSKKNGRAAMIIGESGCGKTYAIDKFLKANPQHTYTIIVNSVYSLTDVITEISNRLRLINVGAKATKLKAIAEKLQEIHMNGGHPIVILDEAENLKQPSLAMIKGLYDLLKDHCAVVMIGTEQLIFKLDRLRKKNKEGMPQLYRRFKAGMKQLSEIDRSFKQFLNSKVTDPGLIKLLSQLCDNYGELNDFLEPALKEADRLGQELSEDLFRVIYDMPKN